MLTHNVYTNNFYRFSDLDTCILLLFHLIPIPLFPLSQRVGE